MEGKESGLNQKQQLLEGPLERGGGGAKEFTLTKVPSYVVRYVLQSCLHGREEGGVVYSHLRAAVYDMIVA